MTDESSVWKDLFEWLNTVKEKIWEYFYEILVVFVLFWLWNWNIVWTIKLFFTAGDYKMIWWGIITLMIVLAFLYVWYWMFNWTEENEKVSSLVKKKMYSENSEISTKVIQITLFFTMIAFFLFLAFYVWYNIWIISQVAYTTILWIFSGWWFMTLIWWLETIWLLFIIFIIIRFLMKLYFQIIAKVLAKLEWDSWLDTMWITYLVWATIVIFFLAIYSFWIAWNNAKIQNVKNNVINTTLNTLH